MRINNAFILLAINAAVALAQDSTSSELVAREMCSKASNKSDGCECSDDMECSGGSSCKSGTCQGSLNDDPFPPWPTELAVTTMACDKTTAKKMKCPHGSWCFVKNDGHTPTCRKVCGQSPEQSPDVLDDGVMYRDKDYGMCPPYYACLVKTKGFGDQKKPDGPGGCVRTDDCVANRVAYMATGLTCWTNQELPTMKPPYVQPCGVDRENPANGYPGCPMGQACVLETTFARGKGFVPIGNGACALTTDCCTGEEPWNKVAANAKLASWTIYGLLDCSKVQAEMWKKKPAKSPKTREAIGA